MDKAGTNLFFQMVCERYKCSSTIITTNKAYKDWAGIFQNDSAVTLALLDRLLDGAESVVIEGSSYRMKNRLEELSSQG